MNRRYFLALGLTLSGTLLTSCDKTKSAAPSKTTKPGGKGTRKIKAGLVTDTGGVGDKSFNAQAWTGLQKAEKELGMQVKYVESKQNADDTENNFTQDNE